VSCKLYSTWREKNGQPPDSDDGEREVRNNIAKVGDAEPSALVGKVVIGKRLRDRWEQMPDGGDHNRDREQE
jgi:hypothetical protein